VPKKQFVSDLTTGDRVDSFFVLTEKKLLDYKSKPGQFLSLILSDRTGSVEGKVWERAAEMSAELNEGDLLYIVGRLETYRQSPQLKIETLETADASQVELGDFTVATNRDIGELKSIVRQCLDGFTSPHLKNLTASLFSDEGFFEQFSAAPAAKALHHAYLGGLLEHIAEVIELCEPMLRLYPQIDRDLLMTGVLLHDIGKIRELSWGLHTEYTDEGRLLGHISIGYEMIYEKIRQINGFPESLKNRVLHMILSHHGVYEFGSPRRPKTIEAQALHLVENLDAQLKGFVQTIEGVRDPAQRWTDFNRRFDRYLYTGYGDEWECPDEDEDEGGSEDGTLFEMQSR